MKYIIHTMNPNQKENLLHIHIDGKSPRDVSKMEIKLSKLLSDTMEDWIDGLSKLNKIK